MGKSNSNYHVAIMGDIVGSEKTPDVERLHAEFNRAVIESNAENSSILTSPLTITLGDEFQGLTDSFCGAFTLVRKLRFRLLEAKINCRFAIGLVNLKSPVNAERAWNMMGEGLSQTRTKLNDKRALSFYRFAVNAEPLIEPNLEALGTALSTIERRWTNQQRRDIGGFLAGASAAELARLRNVSVHSVYKVRSSGDFDAYFLISQTIMEVLAHLDRHYGLHGC